MSVKILFFVIGFFLSLTAFAEPPFADENLENRTIELLKQIRCQVCQGESVYDSNANWAKDVRMLVRDHITKGEDDKTIKDFLIDRYGSHILMNSQFGIDTFFLWLLPIILILAGCLVFWRNSKVK